jgi:hypothetical protein
MTRDINHYNNWQTVIYKQGGFNSRQIEINPGSGVTKIAIYEVRPGEDASLLAANMRALAAKDPGNFGDIEISIKLRN